MSVVGVTLMFVCVFVRAPLHRVGVNGKNAATALLCPQCASPLWYLCLLFGIPAPPSRELLLRATDSSLSSNPCVIGACSEDPSHILAGAHLTFWRSNSRQSLRTCARPIQVLSTKYSGSSFSLSSRAPAPKPDKFMPGPAAYDTVPDWTRQEFHCLRPCLVITRQLFAETSALVRLVTESVVWTQGKCVHVCVRVCAAGRCSVFGAAAVARCAVHGR